MALIVTDMRRPEGMDDTQAYHLYCCNDGLVTRQVFDLLYPRVEENPDDLRIYNAGLAFQAFALALALRGVLVDEKARAEALKLREGEEKEAIEQLRQDPEIQAVWDEREKWDNKRDGYCPVSGKNHKWVPRSVPFAEQTCERCAVGRSVITPLNPHSPLQMSKLFYDKLGMQVRRSRKTGEATTDDEALEALANKYPEHARLTDRVLNAREARKQVSTLKSKLDSDGRWRQSLNIVAAETGRTSSSKSPYRTGGNLQNIADRSRNIFIPDPGLEFFYADGEQAESNVVARDAECPQDIKDHGSGDTHTDLASTIFPNLPWSRVGSGGECPQCLFFDPLAKPRGNCKLCKGSGRVIRDLTSKDIAGIPLPWNPEKDHRDVAKVVRHGTNIGMTWVGIQRALHCTASQAKLYREMYFTRYPENADRQREIRREVKETKILVTPMGRTRLFLGRPWDEATMKEALAQTQQSTIGDWLNTAAWRVFYELDTQINLGRAPRPTDPNRVWLLGQIHDAILGLVRPGDHDTLRRVREIMETPILIRGKPLVIKAEILLGPSWRKSDMRMWKDPK